MTGSVQTVAKPATYTVVLYSDDAGIRDRMRTAIGRRPAADVWVEYLEAATADETVTLVEEQDIDLLLLDGEAWPAGGMGIARQLKDEFEQCPATCVVLARAADRWLASWSRADAVLVHPLDPVRAAGAVADLLRGRTLTTSSP